MVGAIVNRQSVLYSVERELAQGDAVGIAAGAFAGARAVDEIALRLGIADHHVGELAFAVGNIDGHYGRADAAEHYARAALVCQGVGFHVICGF